MNNRIILLIFSVGLLNSCSPTNFIDDLPVGENIRLNQIGFYPDQQKTAIIVGENTVQEFEIWDIKNKEKVFNASLLPSESLTLGGSPTGIANFSSLEIPGEYILVLPTTAKSYPFQISETINSSLGKAAIKAFYYQRASTVIPEEYGGLWAREAGHMDDSVQFHPSTEKGEVNTPLQISANKGWYDAGDYNKYIVNSGITVSTLLSLYEDFPSYFEKLDLNIPESKNGVSDLLDEVKWNLDWMIQMQDMEDGGVYHKLTTASFEGMVSPKTAVSTRYLVSKSTAATLDFAAVMAQASRVFKEINPELSVIYLKASEKAWVWAVENPDQFYNQKAINAKYKPAIVTGEYGDFSLEDEWIWAASELLIATQNLDYWQVLKDADISFVLPSWSKVKWLGFYSILSHNNELNFLPQEWVANLKINLMETANYYQQSQSKNPFLVVMGAGVNDFVWGSNAVAANQGVLLIKAFLLSNNRSFLNSAESNLDYLLGRNATGFSYVTGFGTLSPLNPHHRLSAYRPDIPPIPGFLVGGPNPGQQDQLAYPSNAPDESYLDEVKSYASNEIAINWNAPFAYLVNSLEALEN